MGSTFVVFERYFDLYEEPTFESRHGGPPPPFEESEKPSLKNLLLYSVLITIICCFGILGNLLSLAVLRRKELVGSVYTYLSVLAATDLALSVTYFVGGLTRGALYYSKFSDYDVIVGLPLGGAINSMGVTATVGVTIDRVLYLRNPLQCTKPKFCNRQVARSFMCISLVLSILLNIPYCFIFKWDTMGNLIASDFYYSKAYYCYNLFMLILLTAIPGFVLIFGNGFLIMSLQRARRITKRCNGKRRSDHTNLTITLISIIIMFIITEIPSNLVSRTRAVTLIFFGENPTDHGQILECIRALCTILGAVNIAINFLFYYLFCPAFCRVLRKTLKIPEKNQQLQVNLIVLKETIENGKTKVLEISRNKFIPHVTNNDEDDDKKINLDCVEIIDNLKKVNYFLSEETIDKPNRKNSVETLREDSKDFYVANL